MRTARASKTVRVNATPTPYSVHCAITQDMWKQPAPTPSKPPPQVPALPLRERLRYRERTATPPGRGERRGDRWPGDEPAPADTLEPVGSPAARERPEPGPDSGPGRGPIACPGRDPGMVPGPGQVGTFPGCGPNPSTSPGSNPSAPGCPNLPGNGPHTPTRHA